LAAKRNGAHRRRARRRTAAIAKRSPLPILAGASSRARTAHPHPPLDPLAFGGAPFWVTHCPPGLHAAGKTQSRTELHVVLQLVPEHVYGEQSVFLPLGALSVCIPSQLAASFETHVFVPRLHVNIALHSASLVHDVPHASPAQT
jgi:hypothetical protein